VRRGSTVKGIDVSVYQGTIDWRRVKNDGVRFAFIRVSDGLGFRDSKFDSN
jgi:lysozyme